MTLCKCDCGQEIIKKPHHKYSGIPEYIKGHFLRRKKHSPEVIEKMRQAHLGRKHTPEAIEKIRQGNLRRKLSPEAIEKIKQANLGKKHSPEVIEKIRQAKLGKKHSPEVIEKMRQAHLGRKNTPEHIEKCRQANLGRKNTPETIEKMRQSKLLEKHPNWKGGISFLPYCLRFNKKLKEEIRNRDNRICQNCNKTELENNQKLCVHHIHYDKENCYPDLITLCRSCNVKVNYNKLYWEYVFMSILTKRNLLNYFGENYDRNVDPISTRNM